MTVSEAKDVSRETIDDEETSGASTNASLASPGARFFQQRSEEAITQDNTMPAVVCGR